MLAHLIPVGDPESENGLQLPQAYWAELWRPAVGLLQVVGALHHTLQPLAVLNAKDVADLMR